MEIELLDDDYEIIKKLELKIAKEVKRVCDKHGIQYSLTFGTLLGAVRHQGFIPWDDDIDIMMVRAEYERFIECAKTELNKDYEIVNYEINHKITATMTKIMMKNTIMLEEFSGNSEGPCGVFVDIFPVDNISDHKLRGLIQRYQAYSLEKKILIKSGCDFNKKGLKKVMYKLLELAIFKNKEQLFKSHMKNQLRYDNKPTKYMTVLTGGLQLRDIKFPTSMFDNYEELSFEGVKFSVVKEYDEFLTSCYGDYMSLPPREERVPRHAVKELDLSKLGGRKTSPK